MSTESEIPKVGDIGVKIGGVVYKEGSVLSIKDATVIKIKTQRPNGTFAWEKVASFETDGTDGMMYALTSSESDLDQPGIWTYQLYVELYGASLTSDPETFPVGERVAAALTKYITYDDVLRYTGTLYDRSDIDAMIIEAEDELGDELVGYGLTGDSTSPLLKGIVQMRVQIALLLRGRMDGSKPRTLATGNLTLTDDVDAHVEYLEARIKQKLDLYVAIQTGKFVQVGDLDETSVEATSVHADNDMPSLKLDQQVVKQYHDQYTG